MALPYWWQMRVERWRSAMRGFFGGGEPEQPRPKICPACGTLVGISATRCHQCGTNLNYSMAAFSKRFAGVFGGRAPVTTALLIANILIFGVSVVATLQAGKGGGLSLLSAVLLVSGISTNYQYIVTGAIVIGALLAHSMQSRLVARAAKRARFAADAAGG